MIITFDYSPGLATPWFRQEYIGEGKATKGKSVLLFVTKWHFYVILKHYMKCECKVYVKCLNFQDMWLCQSKERRSGHEALLQLVTKIFSKIISSWSYNIEYNLQLFHIPPVCDPVLSVFVGGTLRGSWHRQVWTRYWWASPARYIHAWIYYILHIYII